MIAGFVVVMTIQVGVMSVADNTDTTSVIRIHTSTLSRMFYTKPPRVLPSRAHTSNATHNCRHDRIA
jgi:hypothetical protein